MRIKYKEVWNVEEGPNPWMSTLVLKPFTTFFTWINVNFIKLKPNTISLISLLFGIVGFYVFYGSYLFLGALCFLIVHVLDCMDGKTARITKQTSRFGAFFDNYMGLLNQVLITTGFAFGQYLISNDIFWLYISPFMIFIILFHFMESSVFALKTNDVLKNIIKKNKKTISKIEKVQLFLMKYELQEPLNVQDIRYIIFFFGPIFSMFFGMLKEIVVISLILLVLKQVFWFFYYRSLLKRQDIKDKK